MRCIQASFDRSCRNLFRYGLQMDKYFRLLEMLGHIPIRRQRSPERHHDRTRNQEYPDTSHREQESTKEFSAMFRPRFFGEKHYAASLFRRAEWTSETSRIPPTSIDCLRCRFPNFISDSISAFEHDQGLFPVRSANWFMTLSASRSAMRFCPGVHFTHRFANFIRSRRQYIAIGVRPNWLHISAIVVPAFQRSRSRASSPVVHSRAFTLSSHDTTEGDRYAR